jgi:hypothetical protein
MDARGSGTTVGPRRWSWVVARTGVVTVRDWSVAGGEGDSIVTVGTILALFVDVEGVAVVAACRPFVISRRLPTFLISPGASSFLPTSCANHLFPLTDPASFASPSPAHPRSLRAESASCFILPLTSSVCVLPDDERIEPALSRTCTPIITTLFSRGTTP